MAFFLNAFTCCSYSLRGLSDGTVLLIPVNQTLAGVRTADISLFGLLKWGANRQHSQSLDESHFTQDRQDVSQNRTRNKCNKQILPNTLCIIEKEMFFLMPCCNDINILCIHKPPTFSCASCCILDSAQSFCGCYLGQFGAGWRLEEAQTGKKPM